MLSIWQCHRTAAAVGCGHHGYEVGHPQAARVEEQRRPRPLLGRPGEVHRLHAARDRRDLLLEVGPEARLDPLCSAESATANPSTTFIRARVPIQKAGLGPSVVDLALAAIIHHRPCYSYRHAFGRPASTSSLTGSAHFSL